MPQGASQDEALAALRSEVDTLRESVTGMTEAASQGEPVDAGALQSEMQALGERIATIENAGGGEELRAAIESERQARETAASETSQRLDAIETEMADNSAEERVAQAFAAAELKSAIDRGGAFSAELDAFSSVAPDNGAAEALAPYAEAGLPSRSALVDRFPDVARDMLAAVRTGSNDGVLDRLMNSAMSVVTVRPTGEVEGDEPSARIARMEARIQEGDFQAALSEWDALPDAAKQASEDYAADLRGRAEADRIADETLAAASGATQSQSN